MSKPKWTPRDRIVSAMHDRTLSGVADAVADALNTKRDAKEVARLVPILAERVMALELAVEALSTVVAAMEAPAASMRDGTKTALRIVDDLNAGRDYPLTAGEWAGRALKEVRTGESDND